MAPRAQKRVPWTKKEDEALQESMGRQGETIRCTSGKNISWTRVARGAGLNRRNGKSCRLRWNNYLNPDLKRGPFTPVEGAEIIQLQKKLGNKWATIASIMQGRSEVAIKNFWNTHRKKKIFTVDNSLEEVQAMVPVDHPDGVGSRPASPNIPSPWVSASPEAAASSNDNQVLARLEMMINQEITDDPDILKLLDDLLPRQRDFQLLSSYGGPIGLHILHEHACSSYT